MTIADRIQQMRKQNGLSQEQLAERLDVSRQAVSKWESGQSIPDVDKIIVLSELFETTTDYLLKGTQPTSAVEHTCNALLFSGAGTILNGAGLIAAIIIWKEWQTVLSVGIGLILMLLGTGIFLAGQVVGVQNREGQGGCLFCRMSGFYRSFRFPAALTFWTGWRKDISD